MANKMKLSNIISCIAAGTLALAMTSCGGKQQAQQAMPTEAETMTIALGNISLNKSYPATIKGKTDIEIRPQVSGFITRVCVDEGQAVRKGQVLFEIDRVQIEAQVRQAEASVAAAKTAVSTAQLTVDNKKKLLDKNIISDYDYQTAANSLLSAQAQLNQAKAALVNAKKSLSYTSVVAPCSGFVGQIPNREGSLVSPSSVQPLTTVSDISEVYAYFSFNEKDIVKMTNAGAKTIQQAIAEMPNVKFQMADGTEYALTGKVSTVSGVLSTSGTATVRALFKNTNGLLRSGSTGRILIPEPSDNQIIIPQSATYELQEMKCVYVLNDSSKAVSTEIQVNPVDDGKHYVVTSGLKVGDVIVTEGVGTAVRQGTLVTPKKAQEADKAE